VEAGVSAADEFDDMMQRGSSAGAYQDVSARPNGSSSTQRPAWQDYAPTPPNLRRERPEDEYGYAGEDLYMARRPSSTAQYSTAAGASTAAGGGRSSQAGRSNRVGQQSPMAAGRGGPRSRAQSVSPTPRPVQYRPPAYDDALLQITRQGFGENSRRRLTRGVAADGYEEARGAGDVGGAGGSYDDADFSFAAGGGGGAGGGGSVDAESAGVGVGLPLGSSVGRPGGRTAGPPAYEEPPVFAYGGR
jgi:hypothetical protein